MDVSYCRGAGHCAMRNREHREVSWLVPGVRPGSRSAKGPARIRRQSPRAGPGGVPHPSSSPRPREREHQGERNRNGQRPQHAQRAARSSTAHGDSARDRAGCGLNLWRVFHVQRLRVARALRRLYAVPPNVTDRTNFARNAAGLGLREARRSPPAWEAMRRAVQTMTVRASGDVGVGVAGNG